MRTSQTKLAVATILSVTITDNMLTAELTDGRTVSVPLAWYPRLLHGTPQERANWRLIEGGIGIHWPDLAEGVSRENLLRGHPSAESRESFRCWLERCASQAT